MLANHQAIAAAKDDESPEVGAFIQLELLPEAITFGGYIGHHRLELFFARGTLPEYRAYGVGYSYFFNVANKSGPFAELYGEHRDYTNVLRNNCSCNNPVPPIYEHAEKHAGLMAGYQWVMPSKALFILMGFGWQYNSNPQNIGQSVFGIGESTKKSQAAAGELALGYYW